jgi:vacuolar-type H+-ATPase subunit I/STV1
MEQTVDAETFDHFWHAVQDLMSHVANPTAVAFASLPLRQEKPPPPTQPDEDDLDQSYYFIPNDFSLATKERAAKQPSHPPTSVTISKSMEEYAMENRQLKVHVDMLSKQLAALEKTARESNALKNSVLTFQSELQKQAKRLNQHPSDLVKSVMNTHDSKRLQQLEHQVSQLTVENAQQRLLISKYRDRWERLKASAKIKQSLQE